jgi:hypothetical protein
MSINHIFDVILFGEDISVSATHDNYNFKQKANLALFIYLIKWFQAKQRFKY